MILLQIIVGWLLADLLSGLVHMAADSEMIGNNFIVKYIIGANASHHDNPLAIVEQGYVSRNMPSWIGTAIIAFIWLWLFGPSIMLATMIAGGILVGDVHRWAHAPRTAPWVVRILQKTGIFQSPKHHALHHRPPHGSRFCSLTNYVNPILDMVIRGISAATATRP